MLLYTPLSLLEDGQKKNVKHSFLNVLEDVRIEKMIQDKYLGSVKVFKKAYTELLEKDFFNINGKDLSKLNLIDRINMHYKNVPDVPFDNDELEWVDKANQTKTSDDVLNLAIELQEWMKANQKDIDSDSLFESDITIPDMDKSEDEDGEQDSDDSDSSKMVTKIQKILMVMSIQIQMMKKIQMINQMNGKSSEIQNQMIKESKN